MEFVSERIENLNVKVEDIITGLVFGMGFTMWVSFQITFFCLITPFIMISLVKTTFFNKFIFFFGFGNY